MFWDEASAFPSGFKLDILDAISIAEKATVRPNSPQRMTEIDLHDMIEEQDHSVIGY